VEDVVADVEGDVLFKIADGLVHAAPALVQVGDAQVLLQLAVVDVLVAEGFDDLLAGRGVFGLVGQDALEQLNGGVPILLFQEMGHQVVEQGRGALAVQDLDDLALDGEEEVHVVRDVGDQLFPDLLDVAEHLLVDEAVQGLLVVLDRIGEVPVLLLLLGQQLDDVRVLVVDLDVAFPDLELLLLVVFVLVAVRQGLQSKLVLAVFQDAVAEELDDVPLVVVHENVDQHHQVGVVHQLFAQGDDPRQVQGDDAVAGVLQVLLAHLQHLVLGLGLDGLPDAGI
jgi:hypothetical protein